MSHEEKKDLSTKPTSNQNSDLPLSQQKSDGKLTHLTQQIFSPQLRSEKGEFNFESLELKEPEELHKPFVVGVCGGNCSGKMDCVESMVKILGKDNVTVLNQENFYKNLPQDVPDRSDYNFDDPEATDWELMNEALECLVDKRAPFFSPLYDLRTENRREERVRLDPKPVIIIEGLLILHHEKIRNKIDLKLYIDTDEDIRLSRRILKDVYQIGKKIEDVITRYQKFVKPAFEKFVQPSKKNADIIIPMFGKPVLREIEDLMKKDSEKIADQPYDNKAMVLIIEQLQQKFIKFFGLQVQKEK
eukprot:CAMPEP_0176433764 /NCGR_PEP_ID=MMETSP0127-20121128/16237_1 /TAXON_ID=938130 /ORGANISM="Platyophrya macrostoma, Strain WH" /LENGTH=301 /DNA_ID=CAMNT_0017816295 /DNA_START=42 /DNA_END=947 /DNA_ORIENTATION=+